MKKIALLAVMLAAGVFVALPAQAAKHKCVPHPVSYVVSGTLTAAGSLTANSDGSYNGSLSVHVTKTNKHAKADKGMTKTYHPRPRARHVQSRGEQDDAGGR